MLRMVVFPKDIIFIIFSSSKFCSLPLLNSVVFSLDFFGRLSKNGQNAMCIVYADSGSVIFTFVPLILTKMVIEVMVWWCWSLCFIYFVDACSLLLIYPKAFCWIILCAARKLMLSYFYIPSPSKNVFTFFYLLKTRMDGWLGGAFFLEQTTFSKLHTTLLRSNGLLLVSLFYCCHFTLILNGVDRR